MKHISAALLSLLALAACTNTPPHEGRPGVIVPGEGNTPDYDPMETPAFDYSIVPYSGLTAADEVSYPPGNPDLNPDENSWYATVTVTYSGSSATVEGQEAAGVTARITGANVDLNLGSSNFIKVVATGESFAGSLRLSGDKKHLLELRDLSLTSTDRPAINDQNKKRVFLMLTGRNRISDGETYVNSMENRKGAFFAEGHVVICGSGVLEVTGNYRHGFVTDGFLYMNPGATLAVLDAKKNAVHVKGSGIKNEYRGIEVNGGYIYAHTSAPAGKVLKCDIDIQLRGGRLDLSCSGNPMWDDTDRSLSSSACIKSDGRVSVSGSHVTLTATGNGGKGINADANVEISGGTIKGAFSGNGIGDQGDTSTPKGIVAHGALKISGGGIALSAIGDNAIALESDVETSIDGGVVYVFGKAYGLKSPKATVANGVLLCGGAENTMAEGTVHEQLTSVAADEVTTLHSPDGKYTIGTFRWPLSLTPASLLTHL